MNQRTIQLLSVVAGLALIVIYSIAMTSSEGAAPWAWLLLFIGIALLLGSGWIAKRGRGE